MGWVDPTWVLLREDLGNDKTGYTIFNRATSSALIIEDDEEHAAVVRRMMDAKGDVLDDIPENTCWPAPEDEEEPAMHGEYRFLRTALGKTGFARITLLSTPSESWLVRWTDAPTYLRERYGQAIDEGVKVAAAAHERLGGSPFLVEVVKLVESTVDTLPDAVRCAAGIAAWKSWGHDEADARLVHKNDEWTLELPSR